MQGPKWPLFYSHLDPVWSLCMVGTSYVLWVELPVHIKFQLEKKTISFCLIHLSFSIIPSLSLHLTI